jgi:uncharacterized protein YndB with AHSA1/START domain
MMAGDSMSKFPIPNHYPWFNPELDLFFERTVNMDPDRIWRAWTEPELLKPWFCPKPWGVAECEIDLRPGGVFSTTMKSPEGMLVPNVGCFVEIVKSKKLVWTNTMGPGFRPLSTHAMTEGGQGAFQFTGMIFLESVSEGTKYTAVVAHGTKEHREIHAQMGFEQGWGIALDQLLEFMRGK